MWEAQAGKFTTSNKVNIDLCLPEFIATKIVSWKCDMDNTTNSRYDMILGRYLITTLIMDLEFSETSSSVVRVHIKGIWHLWLTETNMTLNP